MAINYQIFIRACDKVESAHKVSRPFGLNKLSTIKVSFYSLYKALEGSNNKIVIIGDDLSSDLINFFDNFDNVFIDNAVLGSPAKSLQKQISLALETPSQDWIYLCEDDYLHSPETFLYLTEFIENKREYLKTSPKKKNYINRIIGDLSRIPIIIHPPDYPDRYLPPWRRFSYLFLSKYCHWRQISNTTHTFLLQSSTLKKFEKQIRISAIGPSDAKLSEKVYGRFLFQRKALCISPIKGLSTHMTDGVMTPLIDWELICNQCIDEMKAIGIW